MACGTPVIAGNFGGTTESVVDKETGILFPEQTVDSIIEAVKSFDVIAKSINYSEVKIHAKKFSREIFEKNNIRTVLPNDDTAQWGIGNYTDYVTGGKVPGTATIYFDDAIVSKIKISDYIH
jgi:hypothetical protein